MKIIPYIKITRPFNILLVIIAVLFGAYYKSQNFHYLYPILAAISAALISAFGYIINDYYDIFIDMINKPNRPLPSNKIPHSSAKIFALISLFLGIIISFITRNMWIFIFALCNSFLLFLYAKKGKKMILTGNILVAYLTASTFIYGGISNNNIYNSIFVFCCALLYTLIRELTKDIEDIKGDKKSNAKTVPIIWGKKKTFILQLLCCFILAIVIVWGLNRFYNLMVFSLIIFFIILLIILGVVFVYLKNNVKFTSFTVKYMKIHMLILLILLWVGQ